MYIVRVQVTELPVAYYFSGLSPAGEILYSTFKAKASRWPSVLKAEQAVKPLLFGRVVRYIIEPED